jgi:hypothetical protein
MCNLPHRSHLIRPYVSSFPNRFYFSMLQFLSSLPLLSYIAIPSHLPRTHYHSLCNFATLPLLSQLYPTLPCHLTSHLSSPPLPLPPAPPSLPIAYTDSINRLKTNPSPAHSSPHHSALKENKPSEKRPPGSAGRTPGGKAMRQKASAYF